jgi:hypothetical protein
MAEASRLSTTARALRGSLDALADTLALARPEATAAIETEIEARVRDFRDAASIAATAGEQLPLAEVHDVRLALQRCRRLGLSLTLLSTPFRPESVASQGYSPVGHPLPPSSEGAFLTARG